MYQTLLYVNESIQQLYKKGIILVPSYIWEIGLLKVYNFPKIL